ncbi:MAG: hypothetical protein BWY82_02874 [Verrucomicrobia bacterium ADurb.Bin474]|nr:MAG: hypothetical protein BWY82_02874 [Verrucomicrobia bacterium ADurb.Bin474]
MPLLSPNPGIGPRSVHQGDQRQPELFSLSHHPKSLAVSLRMRTSEVPPEVCLCIPTFLVTDHHYRFTVEKGRARHNRSIILE